MAERLEVNSFHTSPTSIGGLRKADPEEPRKYNHHFKHMTTVGEPIEPEVWRWYYNEVGKRETVIVDAWWQTENGGFLCSTKPASDLMKPGRAWRATGPCWPPTATSGSWAAWTTSSTWRGTASGRRSWNRRASPSRRSQRRRSSRSWTR